MMGKICEMLRETKSVTAIVVVQIAMAGLNVLFKLSMEDGMNPRVLVAYRLLLATLVMFPVSFIFQRKKRPDFTWRLMLLALLSGLIGAVIPTILTITGLALTSATFTSAAGVLIPLITFIFAALLQDQVYVGKAKVFGTLLGVGGALVFTFYREQEIHLWSTNVDLGKQPRDSSRDATTHHISILEALFVFSGKKIGGPYLNATLTNMMGSLVAFLVALCWKSHLNEWRLGWNIRLLTVAYAGIVISGIVISVNAWCVECRGPLSVSVFSPIGLVIVAFVGSLFLGETLHVGSIIGIVIIVGGLYLVLWGKHKEMKKTVTTLDHIETNKTSNAIAVNNFPTLTTNVP